MRVRSVLLHVGQEVGAADQLHREEDALPFGGHELVKAHEVRMVHPGERSKLLLEEIERRRIEVQQRLQRDPLASLAIARLVDVPHPTPANAANDLVACGSVPVERLGRGAGAHVRFGFVRHRGVRSLPRKHAALGTALGGS